MRKNVLILSAIICITIVLFASIGAWIYVQKQNVAQRDRALIQTKQLKEYEQQQLNARQDKELSCKSGNAYNKWAAGCL